jgi:hypothetical protein
MRSSRLHAGHDDKCRGQDTTRHAGHLRHGKCARATVTWPLTSRGDFNPRAQWCLELAKLHAALAHIAAAAQASDGREWARVAGPWFSDLSLALPEQGRT